MPRRWSRRQVVQYVLATGLAVVAGYGGPVSAQPPQPAAALELQPVALVDVAGDLRV